MRREQGVALITVLLVAALVTVICSALLVRQHFSVRSASNLLNARQALYYAEGGELLGRSLLQRDLQRSAEQVDHLGELWARPDLQFELEHGGVVQVHIEDLSGRFNLNSLAADGALGELAAQRFRRLLRALELNPAYVERLQDWLDSDQQPSGFYGAEDGLYLALKPAYRTGVGRLLEVSELRLLLEMSDADYRRLAPLVSVLPSHTELNVNTASAAVLLSLADGLTLTALNPVLAQRRAQAYLDPQQMAQQLGLDTQQAQGLGVSSQHFKIISHVQLGDQRQLLGSYVQRGGDGRVRLIARDLGQDAIAPLLVQETKP